MPLRTPALLIATLASLAGAKAAPRPLELRAAATASPRSPPGVDRALRPLPPAPARPGAYALVERWVAEVAEPPRDGTPRLLVVPVRGGLGLVWARRW